MIDEDDLLETGVGGGGGVGVGGGGASLFGGGSRSTSSPTALMNQTISLVRPDKRWRKYRHYELEVDPDQDDKAKEIRLCSFKRPHMRALHFSWWSFFIAFISWFSIRTLMPDIQQDLNLTNTDVWTANIAAVAGTVVVRFSMGPLCDVYGPRVLHMLVLCTAAIPTACIGLINSATGLTLVRFLNGTVGSVFVMTEYWCSRCFTKEVVGTANAFAAGWGNLGGAFTDLVMGSILYPLFKVLTGGNVELAWRTVSVVPAVITFCSGIVIYKYSDDTPRGNFSELKERGLFPPVTLGQSLWSGISKVNTWLMFIQYACCFGVELTMANASALYFRDQFGQSTEAAAAIASIFSWLNLSMRPMGGMLSDYCNYKWGMRGRIWIQTFFLVGEGTLVLVFAHTSTLGGSIAALVFFSICVQAAEGTSYGIVPYMNPTMMGSVSGIIGSGGNFGAVMFSIGFRQLPYRDAFIIMGTTILASSLLSLCFFIPGYAGMICGEDLDVSPETGEILNRTDENASLDCSSKNSSNANKSQSNKKNTKKKKKNKSGH